MRYRPFGRAGMPVSAIALTLDDRAGRRGPDALAGLIFAALEAGVNAFHIESCEPQLLDAVGWSLAAVERELLVVSLRLGHRIGPTGPTRDFSADALTGAIEEALTRTGLDRLDLVLLDAPGEDELSAAALTALKHERATGRVGLLGIAGAHDAMDAWLDMRAFDVLATPHHPRSDRKERNRVRAAAGMDMGVVAYDYFPELLHRESTAPGRKRRLLDAIMGGPEVSAMAGAGTFAFLHDTRNWTAEELCLAYALMEPSVSTVLIRAHELERLQALAAVPDLDPPPAIAAKVEMARIDMEQAVSTASNDGLADALKRIVSYFSGLNIAEACVALRSRMAAARDEASDDESSDEVSGSGAHGARFRFMDFLRRRSGERVVERPGGEAHTPSPPATTPLPAMTPDALISAESPESGESVGSGEMSGPPPFDATREQPPTAALPGAAPSQTVIWRSKDYDYAIQPTGESFPGPDGRTYLKVDFSGSLTFVPADEVIFPEDGTPPEPAPVDIEELRALEALQARVARIAR